MVTRQITAPITRKNLALPPPIRRGRRVAETLPEVGARLKATASLMAAPNNPPIFTAVLSTVIRLPRRHLPPM